MADAILVNKLIDKTADYALHKLFTKLCPLNNNIEDILIKCTTLNQLYSTNILNTKLVAEHILSINNIDYRLNKGDFTLIENIANIPSIGRRLYSFATKYCALHQPQQFNIYDQNVHKVLKHYLKRKYTNESLKDYNIYREAIKDFQVEFHLEELTAWELDKYLWILGKKQFK